jgi:hypothetical protein
MEDIMGAVGGISAMAIIAWIIRIFQTNRRVLKLAGMQVEMQTRLIDKFGSADELRTYLESDGGKELMKSAPVEKSSPYGRILGSIQAGVILTLGGLAVFLVRHHVPGDQGEEFALMFLGALGIAIGLGFLISAITAFFLSRSWGLINGHQD